MTSIIAGAGLGVRDATVVGGNGQVGPQGRDVATVNVVNGNLVVQGKDEYLAAYGLDSLFARTYNSQGGFDGDNGDGWRLSIYRSLDLSSNPLGTAGPITRTSGDGHIATFTYDGSIGAWVTSDGDGARDVIAWLGDRWEYREGGTGTFETYNTNGHIVSANDADGNLVTYGYTGSLITSVSDASGQVTYISYNGNNYPASITVVALVAGATEGWQQQNVVRVYYGYDGLNRLSSVTFDLTPGVDNSTADGRVFTTTYQYDGNSTRITQIAQTDGSVLNIGYVWTGIDYRISVLQDAQGRNTIFGYDINAHITDVTDPMGQTTRYIYDGAGLLISVTAPPVDGISATTTYGYDARGNLTTVTDADGRSSTYEYDARDRLIVTRNGLNQEIVRTYDSNSDRLTSETVTVNGVAQTTHYVYGGYQRLHFIVSAEGRVTRYEYDTRGNRILELEYTGTLYSGDISDAAISVWADAPWQDRTQGRRVDTAYDLTGQVKSVTRYTSLTPWGVGENGTTTYSVFDAAGRLYQLTESNGALSTTWHDGLDRVVQVQDGTGRITVTQYNDGARTIATTTAAGLVTTSVYNTVGDTVSVTQSQSGQTLSSATFEYDVRHQLRVTTDATGQRSFNLFDTRGRLIATVTQEGEVTRNHYTNAGRILQVIRYANPIDINTLSSGSLTLPALTYSGHERVSGYYYDSAGRVAYQSVAADQDAGVFYVTAFGYDAAGRQVRATQYATPISAWALPSNADANVMPALATSALDRTTRNLYDADGLLIATLDAAGYLTENTYDAAGTLIRSTAYASPILDSGLRDSGNLDQLRGYVTAPWAPGHVGGDRTTQAFYDAQGRVVGEMDAYGYLTRTFYDVGGNVSEKRSYEAAVTSSGQGLDTLTSQAGGYRSQIWSYDALHRLSYTINAEGGRTDYVYDAVTGFLSRRTDAGPANSDLRTTTYFYDGLGRTTNLLSGRGTQVYQGHAANPGQQQIDADAWGNRTVYDAAGRTVRTLGPEGTATFYYYDGDGRIRYTVNALGEVSESRYNAFGEVVATIQYAQRINVSGLTGGLLSQNGNFTGQVNPIANSSLNNITTYTYDDDRGLVTKVTDALGFHTDSSYDAFEQGTTVTRDIGSTPNALRRTDTQTFDQRGQITQTVKDAGAGKLNITTQAEYDAFGRVIKTWDPNNATTQTVYDPQGHSVIHYDELNHPTTTTYDAYGRVLTETSLSGLYTTYTYNDAERSVTATSSGSGLNPITTSTYRNAYGQVIKSVDGNGSATRYAYDADGNQSFKVDPLGYASGIEYDKAGRVIQQTQYDKNVGQWVTNPSGEGGTAYGWWGVDTASNTVAGFESGDYALKAFTRDGLSGFFTVTSGERIYVSADARRGYPNNDGQYLPFTIGVMFHDEYGNPAWIGGASADPAVIDTQHISGWIDVPEWAVDAAVWIQINGLWDNTGAWYFQNAYVSRNGDTFLDWIDPATAALGWMPARPVPSENDCSTRYGYDIAGRKTFEINAVGAVTSYEYDVRGNVVAVDTSGRVTRYAYDAVSQKTFEVDELGAVTHYVYNAAGSVIQIDQYKNLIGGLSDYSEASIREAVRISNGGSVIWEGTGFYVFPEPRPGTVALHELYYFGYNHYYTVSEADRDNVLSDPQFSPPAQYLGIIGYVYDHPVDGASPLYESWASSDIFTTNYEEYLKTLNMGWTGGGIVAYVNTQAVDGAIAAHRLYDISTGAHWFVNSVAARDEGVSTALNKVGTYYTYDAAGRLVGKENDLEQYEQYEYNAAGNKTAYVDASGNKTRYVHDARGQLRFEVNALGGVTGYEYDAAGNVIENTVYAQNIGQWISNPSAAGGTAEGWWAINAVPNSVAGFEEGDYALQAFTRDGLSGFFAVTPGERIYVSTDARRGDPNNDGRYLHFTLGVQFRDSNGNPGWYGGASADPNVTDAQHISGWIDVPPWAVDAAVWVQINELWGNTGTWYFQNAYVSRNGDAFLDWMNQSESPLANLLTHLSKSPNDQHTHYTYDAAGRLRSTTDAKGYTEYYGYDDAGNKISFTNKLGKTWTYAYDAAGRLTNEYAPPVDLQSTGIDSWGRVVVGGTEYNVTLITHYEYDSQGNLRFKREAYGRPDQRTTEYRYDVLGRQIEVVYYDVDMRVPNAAGAYPSELTTRTWYDAKGQAVAGRDMGGDYSYKLYDLVGHLSYEVDANRNVTYYQYDALGNAVLTRRYAVAVNDATFSSLQAAGDILGAQQRLEVLVPGLSTAGAREITTEYDALGRKTKVTQPIAFQYDTNAAVSNRGGNFGAVTTYEYDALGNLVRQSELINPVTNDWTRHYFYYDELGHQIAKIDETTQLEDNGALTRGGYLTTLEYDAFGNLVHSIEYANRLSQGSYSIGHYAGPSLESYGNPTWTPGMGSNVDGYGNSILQTNASSLAQRSYRINREQRYEYDALNRQTAAIQIGADYTSEYSRGWGQIALSYSTQNLRSTIEYDAVGNVISSAGFDGAKSYSYYDNLGRLMGTAAPLRAQEKLGVTTPAAQSPYISYTYDALGNRVSETRHANGLSNPTTTRPSTPWYSSSDQTTYFAYDKIGREIGQKDAENNSHRTVYDYAGNVAITWIRSSEDQTFARTKYEYDQTGRQTATQRIFDNEDTSTEQVEYNAFGEVTRKGIRELTATGGWQSSYDYDNAGRLWRRTEGGVVTLYAYNAAGFATVQLQSGTQSLAGLFLGELPSYAGNTAPDGWVIRRTEYLLNASGQALRQITPRYENPLNTSAAFTPVIEQRIDRWGNVTRRYEAYVLGASPGAYTEFGYDWRNQIVMQRSPTIRITTASGGEADVQPTEYFGYDAGGHQMVRLDANAHATVRRYDGAGQFVLEYRADGTLTGQTYDLLGRVISKQVPRPSSLAKDQFVYTTYDYDKLDRVIQVTNPVGGKTLYRYNAHGDVTQQQQLLRTGDGGMTWVVAVNDYGFDGQGRLTTQTLGGEYTRHITGANFHLLQQGITTSFSYDLQDRKIGEADALGYNQVWVYDDFGRLATYKDRQGQNVLRTTATAYNFDGSVKQQRTTLGTTDQTIGLVDYYYTTNGWLWEKTDSTRVASGGAAGTGGIADSSAQVRRTDYRLYNLRGQVLDTEEYQGSSVGTLGLQRKVVDEYDNLGRLTKSHQVYKTGSNGADSDMVTDLEYKHDAGGNRRRIIQDYNSQTYSSLAIYSNHRDLGYTYDAMDRVVIDGGVFQSGQVAIEPGIGREFRYDAQGNRISERTLTYGSYSGSSHDAWEYYTYDTGGRLAQKNTTEVIEGEIVWWDYNVEHQTITYSNYPTESIYQYDFAGRKTVQTDSEYAGQSKAYKQHLTFSYFADGRLERQYAYKSPTGALTYSADYSLTGDYDAAGNLKHYQVTVSNSNGNNGYNENYNFQYERIGGHHQEIVQTAVRQYNSGTPSGTARTIKQYDTAGSITSTMDQTKGGVIPYYVVQLPSGEKYILFEQDAYTESYPYGFDESVLRPLSEEFNSSVNAVAFGSPGWYEFYPSGTYGYQVWNNTKTLRYDLNSTGQIERKYSEGTPTQTRTSLIYAYDGLNHSLGYSGVESGWFQVDYALSNASMTEPTGEGSSRYVVSDGDSLQSIAQSVYGDASLWYVIADANGIRSQALTAGLALIIPKVSSVSNEAGSFKPYSASEIIGDTSPTIPAPPKPPKQKCKALSQVIAIVVAVIVTAVVAAYTRSPQLGAAAGAAAGNDAYQTSAAMFNGRYDYGAALKTIAGGVPYAAISGDHLVAALIAPHHAGMKDGFDYKGMMISGAAGLVGSAVGGWVGNTWNQTAGSIAGGVSANVTAQVGNIALDRQQSFSWNSVAASAAGSYLGHTAGNSLTALGVPGFYAGIAAGAVNGLTQQTVTMVLDGRGKIELASIAADAFGNALGNSIVGAVQSSEAEQQARRQNRSSSGILAEGGTGDHIRFADAGEFAAGEYDLSALQFGTDSGGDLGGGMMLASADPVSMIDIGVAADLGGSSLAAMQTRIDLAWAELKNSLVASDVLRMMEVGSGGLFADSLDTPDSPSVLSTIGSYALGAGEMLLLGGAYNSALRIAGGIASVPFLFDSVDAAVGVQDGISERFGYNLRSQGAQNIGLTLQPVGEFLRDDVLNPLRSYSEARIGDGWTTALFAGGQAALEIGGLLTGTRAIQSGINNAIGRSLFAELKAGEYISTRAPGLGNSRFFTSKSAWTSPSNGTGLRYDVYRQTIDWDLSVDGLTNLERAFGGKSPYVMKNGAPERLNLHHSRQNGEGPLFELSESTHLRTQSGFGREALHPYGNKPHPFSPVNRPAFNIDKSQYWIDRANEVWKP